MGGFVGSLPSDYLANRPLRETLAWAKVPAERDGGPMAVDALDQVDFPLIRNTEQPSVSVVVALYLSVSHRGHTLQPRFAEHPCRKRRSDFEFDVGDGLPCRGKFPLEFRLAVGHRFDAFGQAVMHGALIHMQTLASSLPEKPV